jgi:hypothetical protein
MNVTSSVILHAYNIYELPAAIVRGFYEKTFRMTFLILYATIEVKDW